MLQLDLASDISALPIDSTSMTKNRETSVVIASTSSNSIEMFSWQTLPAAVSMSGEKTQDMMSLSTFFQQVRCLLGVGEDTVAVFFSKTIRLI